MKRMNLMIIGMLMVLLLGLSPVLAEVLETIDAVVNGQLLLSGEVNYEIRTEAIHQNLFVKEGNGYRIPEDTYRKLREKVLPKLIDDILLMQVVREQLTAEEMEKIRDTVQRQTDIHMAKFQQEFNTPEKISQQEQKMGMSWEEYREATSRQFFINYIKNVIVSQLSNLRVSPPTPEELEAFQKNHPDQKPTGEIQIQHIQLNLTPSMNPEEEDKVFQKAQEIALRARGGDPFEYLVFLFSQNESTRKKNGMLPPFTKGKMMKEFDVLFDMEVGQITDPIKTPTAYHIIKILSKDTWASRVMNMKKKQKLSDWLDKLKEQSDIEIRNGSPLLQGSTGH